VSSLHPSTRRRRRAGPAIVAVVVVVVLVGAGGWYFLAKHRTTPAADAGATCTTHSPVPTVAMPLPRQIVVNVYNSTTRSGLARSTGTQLAARGFHLGAVANDPLNDVIAGTAQVRFGPAAIAEADVVAAQVPRAVLVRVTRTGLAVDLALGYGFTALTTPAQAAAAVGAAERTLQHVADVAARHC
jgi:LytR cell envelope-related transcriptional attenuator